MRQRSQLFAVKPIDVLLAEMAGEHRLRRVLGPVTLTSLGVGAIIGAGIFVLTGLAANVYAGPGLILSFVFAGIGCALAALCYAEFASMVPVAGSAYTYAYATLGELFAWIIGWDLILEYAMSAATVASAWSEYFNKLTDVLFKWQVPAYLSNDPFTEAGAWLNLPAVIILALVTVQPAQPGLQVWRTDRAVLDSVSKGNAPGRFDSVAHGFDGAVSDRMRSHLQTGARGTCNELA